MITWLLVILSQICLIFGEDLVTPTVQIMVEFPPPENIKTLPNGTINIAVQRGQYLVMVCRITDKPLGANTKILWTHTGFYDSNGTPYIINTGTVSKDQSRFRISQGIEEDTLRLEIPAIDESYTGIFACEVQYSGNVENAKDERLVTIYDPPSMEYTEYKNQIQTNKDVTFDCQVKGFPTPTVYWKRIGGVSNVIKEMGVMTYGSRLELKKVTYKDAGVYSCSAENIHGKMERHYKLSVIHDPIVEIFPNGQDAYQKLGCLIQLTCQIRANPVASAMQWSSKKKGSLKTEGRFTLKILKGSDNEMIYILRIFPTYEEDFEDEFMCTAKNMDQQDSKTITIRKSDISNPLMSSIYTCAGCNLSINLFSILLLISTILFKQCF